MTSEHLPVASYRREDPPPALDIRDQKTPFSARQRPQPPEGAPNVLVILLDDMGFGASSAFGGPCRMPTAERLADDGLRYSRFHTTALCSPTRAALMTGRNHHSVAMGNVVELSTTAPGYDGMRPETAGTLAQTLSLSGYATGAFGKWHQTPPWEQTAAGPFDHWPTREGFDRFYGFLGGEASQFNPTLVDGTTFVDPPATEQEGYHLSEDLVDKAGGWIRDVTTFGAGKPWFCYLAFGATHAPFQVPQSWRGRYRGEFAHGWDRQREITLAAQKELGVVPEQAELAPWVEGVPHWDELTDSERLAAERLMETYASFAEHTDAQVGRLIDELRSTGQLDNTVVFYILGDNGASAEGGIEGTLNETLRLNGLSDTTERILDHLDEIGGPHSYVHYPVGWALAMDTPYQWTKQVASHYGGTRNGLVVHWPKGITARGEVRNQWHHVIDIAPTVLEAAGLPEPKTINGIAQDPIQGTSLLYSFDDSEAPERHTTQYFEMFGNRGIYREGWTAVTQHRTPWKPGQIETTRFSEDVWELYDTQNDWTQAHDIAAERPDKLAELQELFLAEARGNNVLPLDDRLAERMNADIAGRRSPHAPSSVVLTQGSGRLREDAIPGLKNTSFRISVELGAGELTDGVLVAQGGRFAGWSLYVKDGHPTYAYNLAGLEVTQVGSAAVIGPGQHTLELSFAYDGGGLGKGGLVRLVLDGDDVGSGRLERTIPFFFSMDETLNVGLDRGSPVTEDYADAGANAFAGTIQRVTLTVGDDTQQPSDRELLGAVLTAH
ncbi:MAG: hypothetical protein QOD35_1477 [Nocardioidaceae bacterium]|nr:hypothetical protein [Nocardioidaceae bacterium]